VVLVVAAGQTAAPWAALPELRGRVLLAAAAAILEVPEVTVRVVAVVRERLETLTRLLGKMLLVLVVTVFLLVLREVP
jgi:hypothetical protein